MVTKDKLREMHQSWYDDCVALENLEAKITDHLLAHHKIKKGSVVLVDAQVMAIRQIKNANLSGEYAGTRCARRGAFPSLSCDCIKVTKKMKLHAYDHRTSFNTNSSFEVIGECDASDMWGLRGPVRLYEEP